MNVGELIKRLQREDAEQPVVLYFLKDYTLHNCDLETIVEADGQVEITIQLYDTDEGGNKKRRKNNGS